MKRLRQINAPVFAFFLTLLGGWGLFLYTGNWWWLVGAILVGIMVGDFVQAVVMDRESRKSNAKKEDKKNKK